MQFWLDLAHEAVTTLGFPLALALAWKLIGLLQQHGYRTTYAAALLRAVGQGQIAAKERGVSLFSPAGRAIASEVGAAYLMSTVSKASNALGIKPDDHAVRIVGQIGDMMATAEAAAQPPTTRVPSDTILPFSPPSLSFPPATSP
jgi:hypothetical protein